MYWNEKYETMPREQLAALQLYRLQRTVELCYTNNAVYRKKLDDAGVKPSDIRSLEDIRRIPFTVKTDLRDNYPDGMSSSPKEKIVRYHVSSGTTGKPTVVGYTQYDIDSWSECIARCLGCAGMHPGDTLQVCFGYGLFTGGLGLHYGGEHMGVSVVPAGTGNTKRQIMLMQDLHTNGICCTPSYALYIADTLQEMNFDMSKLDLRVGILGAEAWSETMRTRIEELLHIDAVDIYGLSETMGPGVAGECIEGKGGLHIWEDHFIPEIINPDTLEPVPDGEYGELVITTIHKTGMPTLRYRTRDITRIISEPCPCGRTHRRLARLRGRTDDMLIIRGINVFPSQIETVLASFPGVMPHYMLLVDRVHELDTLEVQVELAPDMPVDEVRQLEQLQKKLAAAIREIILLDVKVTLLQPGSIERTQGKAKHVIDKRIIG